MKNLGSAVRPHGVKGGVIFRTERGCVEEVFLKDMLKPGITVHLFLSGQGRRKKRVILENIIFGKKIILYFQGYPDRNSVERLLPFELRVEADERCSFEDLRGFTVFSQGNGDEVGKVVSVGNNGVQKILEIRGKVNFDIPWVPQFVEKIDRVEKKVFVWVPEYDEA